MTGFMTSPGEFNFKSKVLSMHLMALRGLKVNELNNHGSARVF